MPDKTISELLRRLGAPEADEAWTLFLEEYAPLIFQVVRHLILDADDAADCFQFVCEQFVKDSCRRLRRFQPEGPALFSTWLRAVVRNLCLDWRRKQYGRPRLFRSIERLSLLDQEIFRQVHERAVTEHEAFELLIGRFPELTPARVSDAVERINRILTASQSRTLQNRSAPQSIERDEPVLADQRADPEAQAIENEKRSMVLRALKRLPSEKRLLLKLRFEEALTLEELARLLNLGNAQRADREIKQALSLLRRELGSVGLVGSGGKDSHSSVKVRWKNSV